MSSNFERLRARLGDLQNLLHETVESGSNVLDEALDTVQEYLKDVEDKATPVFNVNFTDAMNVENLGKRLNDFLGKQQAQPAPEEPQAEPGGSDDDLLHVLTVVKNYLVKNGYTGAYYETKEGGKLKGRWIAEDLKAAIEDKLRRGETSILW